jgi:Ca-activated chloride channel homolog
MERGQQGAKTGQANTGTQATSGASTLGRPRGLGRAFAHVGHLVLSVSVLSSLGLSGAACTKREAAPASRAESSSERGAVGQATATSETAPEDDASKRGGGRADGTLAPPPAATLLPHHKDKVAEPKENDELPSPATPGRSGKSARGPVMLGGEGDARSPSPAFSPPAKLDDAEKKPSGGTGPEAPRVQAPPIGAFGGKGSLGGYVRDKATEAPIDPNGRFATTYRPGAGHLAAFDSAVARGIVPAEEKEVVSDLGARYSPDFALPKGKTLFAQNELERAKQPPAGGPVHLRIALKSADVAPAARPHLSVHLVLDVSGSMAGASIENARTAAAALVDKLAPGDDFSLVTFSSDAQVLVPDGPVGARRAAIKKTIEGIHEGGGTNIGEGLTLGYKEASKASIPADAVKVVLLLSDGRANSGILDQGRLSTLALNAFQDGVQTSTFGLGGDYDGALMSSIANDGAGGYYYLRDAQQIAPALATEMDKRLDPVATALEVRVRLRPGVQLLQAYGSRRLNASEEMRVRVQEIAADVQAEQKGIKRDRQDDQKGGMRFFLPGFARNDAHAILLKLSLPEGVGDKEVALVELKYKDRVKKTNVQEELVVKTSYAGSDAESAGTINGSVARSVQGFAAGETLAEASRLIANGSRDSAVAVLSEREGILRQMADTMNEPLFLKDADRVARLRSHAGSTTGLGDPLVLAMLLETASNAHRR